MSAGAELSQGLAADAATYTLTIEGRTAGGQTPEVIASYVTSKKPAAVGAAKRSGLSSADSTASLVAAGYIGTNNIDVANSIHVALAARFSAAGQSCVVFLALYDASDGLIGITNDFTLQGDDTFTDGTLYVSPSQIVDVHAASQVFPVLRTAPISGTVSLYLEAL